MRRTRAWTGLLVVTMVLGLSSQSVAALVNIFSDYAPGKPYAVEGPATSDWNGNTLTINWQTNVPASSPYVLDDVKTFVIDLVAFVFDPQTISIKEEPFTYSGGGVWTYRDITATLTDATGLEIPDPTWDYLKTTTRQDGIAYPFKSLGNLAPGETGNGEIHLDFSRQFSVLVASDDFANARLRAAPAAPEPATLVIWLGLVLAGGLMGWRRLPGRVRDT